MAADREFNAAVRWRVAALLGRGPVLSEMLWRPAELGACRAPFGGAFSPLSACEIHRRFP